MEKRGHGTGARLAAMCFPHYRWLAPSEQLHPVSDLTKAKAVYSALLGLPPQHDADYYVGFDTEGQHIGLVPGGGPESMTSPVAYWHVSDIEAKIAEVTAAGATVNEAPRDVGGGRLVASVTDPDGNVLGLLQDR
jgi:predicted enzyme related to lactoylglutathione lyase